LHLFSEIFEAVAAEPLLLRHQVSFIWFHPEGYCSFNLWLSSV
jgi:hypothetical protein